MHNNSLIIETDDGSVVDLSVLAKYIDIAKNIASISKMMAPVTLQSLIEGQDIAGEMLSKNYPTRCFIEQQALRGRGCCIFR